MKGIVTYKLNIGSSELKKTFFKRNNATKMQVGMLKNRGSAKGV